MGEPCILSEPLCSHLERSEDALNTCLAVWCDHVDAVCKVPGTERAVGKWYLCVCVCDENIIIQQILSGGLLRMCYCSGVLGIKNVLAQGA